MINYFLPILAVLIGFLLVLLLKFRNKNNIKLFLAYSGAFLLSLTIFELLPDVFVEGNTKNTSVFIMLGILLQIFLEFFSKGAEHGHVHIHEKQNPFPWLLFISLSIHAVLEGFPINQHDTLIYAIVIHKISIAIILSSFFLESSVSRGKIAVFLILFALMTPLGSVISDHVELVKTYYTEISALVIGIFLHISTTILFESSEGHKFNITKMIVILLGVITAYFL
ncbi:ZIP family metal transporter [Leptobacterium flavescens]|uniref:ZIP family metal transporter n=1 Tax=Leptobacterium flavescens TaxID=472055 RepID=A0A6P0UMF5_9FLAO|nr:ZIP family metal transporter [Leptobacterium flavescens]NER14197.1 ZIP family metal transporter [Leptobacterium flavescens]